MDYAGMASDEDRALREDRVLQLLGFKMAKLKSRRMRGERKVVEIGKSCPADEQAFKMLANATPASARLRKERSKVGG
jgi:L-alanine-DL-glutamate epimerase-like enolase superfamily enzyme